MRMLLTSSRLVAVRLRHDLDTGEVGAPVLSDATADELRVDLREPEDHDADAQVFVTVPDTDRLPTLQFTPVNIPAGLSFEVHGGAFP